MYKIMERWTFLKTRNFLVTLVLTFLVTGLIVNYFSNKSADVRKAEMVNWKTYTYKNLSFKYPDNYIVIFDSEVSSQPNGFSLHVVRIGDGGFQPDELSVSTYNNRSDTPNDYVLNTDRTFSLNQNGNSYIKFVVKDMTVYVGCGYYSKGKTTLDVCNKIVSTVTIK